MPLRVQGIDSLYLTTSNFLIISKEYQCKPELITVEIETF